MGRNPWVWFSAAVVTATVILTLGTIAAFRFDLDVDWYTGAGQWLGAAVSVLAAGTALWIATNDRKKAVADRRADRAQLEADRRADRAQVEMDRRADRAQLEADRQAERSQLEADLLREAGLVRLTDLSNTGDLHLDYGEPPPTGGEVSVTVRNHRVDRICDLDLRVVAAPPADGDAPNPAAVEQLWTKADLHDPEAEDDPRKCSIASDDKLYIKSRLNPWAEAVLVTLRYTDQRGRRWQIDPDGNVERVTDPPPPSQPSPPPARI